MMFIGVIVGKLDLLVESFLGPVFNIMWHILPGKHVSYQQNEVVHRLSFFTCHVSTGGLSHWHLIYKHVEMYVNGRLQMFAADSHQEC